MTAQAEGLPPPDGRYSRHRLFSTDAVVMLRNSLLVQLHWIAALVVISVVLAGSYALRLDRHILRFGLNKVRGVWGGHMAVGFASNNATIGFSSTLILGCEAGTLSEAVRKPNP